MKRYFSIAMAIALFAGMLSCEAQSQKSNEVSASAGDQKVTVYYFHMTSRCVTCRNVEAVSKQSVQELYPQKYQSGEIEFKEVNLELPENQKLIESLKVHGQSLLVVKGDKQHDITDKGFLYARSQPDRLKEEIRKAVESL